MPHPLLDRVATYITLAENEAQEFLQAFTENQVAKGEYLLQPGKVCQHIHFIAEGLVRHYHADEAGQEITCDFTPEGRFLTDLMSLRSGEPSQYAFIALESTHYYSIPRGPLEQLYAKYPAMETMGRQITEETALRISHQAQAFITQKAEDRYRNFVRQQPELVQRVPQKYVAAYLGIKPESLSRIRKQMMDAEKP
ncbi:MAG TPA: Crp/Fnr family transcriptional regulator [Cytophagales bacterium]|nr:Crp/Fnr family transcriptional regulator [Cytophagales bacterium]HAA18050.1 Crp/Fnr family transcriptional regulator [Cytophagales bacterium]HAP63759.1 Crp/Fnr family transcriptional regulator [Cytophagales bacterium]